MTIVESRRPLELMDANDREPAAELSEPTMPRSAHRCLVRRAPAHVCATRAIRSEERILLEIRQFRHTPDGDIEYLKHARQVARIGDMESRFVRMPPVHKKRRILAFTQEVLANPGIAAAADV